MTPPKLERMAASTRTEAEAMEDIGKNVPQLARGLVWCRHCGRGPVKVRDGLTSGWPKCCGYTMTIDSTGEQQAMAARCPECEGRKRPLVELAPGVYQPQTCRSCDGTGQREGYGT